MTLRISSLPSKVLTLIFWFCGTRDWMSLATTSRALSPLALQCIWHTIPSFAILIYTLHPDLWTCIKVDLPPFSMRRVVRKHTPTRKLVADDFARSRFYYPFIRVVNEALTRPLGWKVVLSAPLWDAFQKHCPEPLPNLHTVSFCRKAIGDNLGDHFGDHFYTLLGPSLRTFELEVKPNDRDRLPHRQAFNASKWHAAEPKLFIRLGQQCPQLQNLRLDPCFFSANSTGPLAAAAGGWDNLRSLKTLGTPLQASTLKHLATLPCLYLLKINIMNLPIPAVEDELITRSGVPGFPALRELVIHSSHLGACTPVVLAVRSPLLDKVDLYATEHATPDTIGSLCTALSRHIGLKTLLIGPGVGTCEWRDRGDRGLYPEPYLGTPNLEPVPLTLPVLAPLLSLRSLQDISLRGTCYASLDDRAIPDLVRAWPNMKAARLCPHASHPYQTRVTLAGLAPLAELSRLHHFGIALSDVYAEDVDAALKLRPARLVRPARSSESHRSHVAGALLGGSRICPMINLYVGHARLPQDLAEGVSAALSAWFPELEVVEGLMRPGDCTAEELARMGFNPQEAASLYRRWIRVPEVIHRYVRVRKQEQRWARKQLKRSMRRQ